MGRSILVATVFVGLLVVAWCRTLHTRALRPVQAEGTTPPRGVVTSPSSCAVEPLPVPGELDVVVAPAARVKSPCELLLGKIQGYTARYPACELDSQIVYLAIQLAEELQEACPTERQRLAEQALNERDTVLSGLLVLCLGAVKENEFHELLEGVFATPGEHPATEAAILSFAIPQFGSPAERELAMTCGSTDRFRVGVFAEVLDGILEPSNGGFPKLKAELCSEGVLPDGLGNTYIPLAFNADNDPSAVRIVERYRTKLSNLSCGKMVASLLGSRSK